MRAFTTLLIAILLTGALSLAQSPSGFEAPQKDNKATPMDLLHAFEAPEETDYVLGEGDQIQITVANRPELSGKQMIGPDGMVTLPIVGSVRFAGLTRTVAAKAAEQAWQSYYDNVTVTVQVLEYQSNHIFVLGRVASPGILHFDTQPTLLEAVTRAGGLPIGGIGAEKAALSRCMVFRGQDKVVWIELRSLLNGSNLALNIRLQRNDVLYIPDSDDQLVFVMGEVRKPGAIRVTPDMTFLNAIAQAGGPTEDAKTGKIHLVRPSTGIEQVFDLAEFYHGGPNHDVSVKDGDIIYVSRSRIGNVGYVLNKLSPLTGWMVFSSALVKP